MFVQPLLSGTYFQQQYEQCVQMFSNRAVNIKWLKKAGIFKMKKQPLESWAKLVGGKKSRWFTLVLWVIVILILSMSFPQINSVENSSLENLPKSMMSEQAQDLIDEEFPSDSGTPLLVVWHNKDGITIEDIVAIQTVYQQIGEQPLTNQQELPPFGNLPPQAVLGSVSENGTTLVTPIFFDKEASTEILKENLNELSLVVEESLQASPFDKNLEDAGMHVRFSGPVGIQVDATDLFKQADVKLLVTTVILILVLLIIIYRSPLLAIIPLVIVGFAYGAISPLLGWMAENGWITKDAQAVSIMTVLLFGAGTDYCLFLITRYRETLLVVEDRLLALRLSVKESGGAILMSAITVVIGLAILGLADYGSFQRFAVPFSFAIFIMGIAALTILPAVLALLGRAAFFPFIPRTVEMEKQRAAKKGKPYKERKENHRSSRKIGKFVTHKPWLVIVVTLVVLGGLATFVPQVKYSYDLLSSFPEDMPSREGFTLIANNFSPGELAPVKIVVDTEGKEVDLQEVLKQQGYIDVVKEPQIGQSNADLQLIEVDLTENPYSNEAMALIPELKDTVATALESAGITDAKDKFWIGGETSAQYDTKQVTERDESLIQPVMISIIALLLIMYLRSVTATIYLIGTVVLSYIAALGAGWLVLHYIFGADAIAASIPLYSFVFLVALGEDYNIFMVSEIWKNKKTQSHRVAVQNGVTQTGSVITSAGLILAGTFAVLATLPIQVLVQFGVVTAIGVLLDTFVVRPLLVPALTTVLGRFAFWPGSLFKKKD